MDRWEIKVWSVDTGWAITKRGINAQFEKDLGQLGADGWEPVGITPRYGHRGVAAGFLVMLKRPKVD